MADAEDLKSSGDFSSCGFDSHPGHQFVCPALAKDFLDILCLLAIITSGQIMACSKAAASVAAFFFAAQGFSPHFFGSRSCAPRSSE